MYSFLVKYNDFFLLKSHYFTRNFWFTDQILIISIIFVYQGGILVIRCFCFRLVFSPYLFRSFNQSFIN